MILLAVNSLAAYSSWGIFSSLVPAVRAGSRTWRIPAWTRALMIAGIAYGLYSVPVRYVNALACTAIVLFLMMIALRLGASLPEPHTIVLPSRTRRTADRGEMRGYSPASGTPARRIPKMD